ncbi:unnamed protein product (macronuclear) [Paramecium tetraurelia]|uniref:Uncharacterized protein n=1 Tax=Paramecium tetraurelia TaxID=5888 RepID=A0BMA7_PARTE|nr:uncharacterized protein GSPATT00030310001 [Paramecium tetraurelia]CAK59674.1 unnamed protein product [Paramecium tetraurelia]|eukprot:XP_001427072.1 hypothetical protein (macronuclear) [Paramecium tetraurelia strain d4-2]
MSNQLQIDSKVKQLPQDVQDSTYQSAIALSQYLKIWDVDHQQIDYFYPFQLPPSSFIGNCQIFPHRPDLLQNEYHQVQDLSNTQISQIFQSGTFEIQSMQFQIPYVWQISSFIVKGRQNITKSYFSDIGMAYHIYKFEKNSIYNERDSKGRECTIRCSIYNIFSKLTLYLSLLIGFRETYIDIDIPQLKNQIEAKRQIELKQSDYYKRQIYEYLYFENNEQSKAAADNQLTKLMLIQTEFRDHQQGLKLSIQNQFDYLVEQFGHNQKFDDHEEQKEYLENINEQIKLLERDYLKEYEIQVDIQQDVNEQINNATSLAQLKFWQSKLGNELPLVSNINELNECGRALRYYQQLLDVSSFIYGQNELQQQMDEFEKKLIQDHPIRIKSYHFLAEQRAQYRKQMKTQLKEKYRILLIEDLKKQNIKEVELYLNYLQQKAQLKQELQLSIEKIEKESKRINISIDVTRRCFPPYNIIKTGDYYSLERTRTYFVDSSFPLWKFYLMIVRYFAWTANVTFWLFANGISGPLGIRALVQCNVFYPDVQINERTGVVSRSNYSVTPVVVHMGNVCKGMSRSRREFEGSPDTGFFGKNCARICNYVEVYFFRFLIVGIVGVLIVIPALIIANFVISLVLALTAWAWIPFVLIISYLFQLLIFDFDCSERQDWNLLSTPIWFPLFLNTFDFIVKGVLNLIWNLLICFIILPISSIFMVLFGHLRYIFRSLYDCLMIIFVKCLGRVPATENWLAWKVSGPGISRQYYFTVKINELCQIKNEEALILVAGELEKCVLKEYQRRVEEEINGPQKQVQSVMNNFFSVFGVFQILFEIQASYSFHDRGCDKLIQSLNQQISSRISILPQISNNIRFNESELIVIRMLIKQLIKNQIKLKDMKNYIWKHYQVQKGDYNELTSELLKKCFGHQVLSPLEDIDLRFSLQTDENYSISKKISKALEGQVNLNQPTNFVVKSNSVSKKSVIVKQFLEFSGTIQEVWGCQSIYQNWSTLSDKSKRFFINYCLRVNQEA